MMPMTTFGGDGKAPDRSGTTRSGTERHNLTMSDETNVEDVAQCETTDNEADTSKGWKQRLEELPETEPEGPTIRDDEAERLRQSLPDLPTEDEAELGELFRVPKGQFEGCSLIDDETPALIEFHSERPKGSTDQEVREAIEAVEVRL